MLISDFIAYLFNLPLDFLFRHIVMFSCFIEHLFSRFIHAFYYRVVYAALKFQFFHSSKNLNSKKRRAPDGMPLHSHLSGSQGTRDNYINYINVGLPV